MMTNAQRVHEFLNQAGVWYFLTTDGNQPKGRPFRFHLLKDDTIYFGTGTFKQVFRQMTENPHVEILAVCGDEFLRYDGEAVLEESNDLAAAVLANAPDMQKIYNDTTGYQLGMFHLVNGTVEICTALGQKEAFQV